jgi:hypothetical protein
MISSLSANAQFTDVINSNRPGESMSAFSVGKTVIQAELGVSAEKTDHSGTDVKTKSINPDLVVRYGALLEQLEFIGKLQYGLERETFPGDYDTKKAFRQGALGAKYLVYDPNKKYVDNKPNLYSYVANHKFKWRSLIPAVGIYIGGNFKLSNDFSPPDMPGFTAKGMIITQQQLGHYVLITNIIADKFGSNYSSLAYIVTLTYGVNDRWSAFIENQGIQSDYYGDLIFRGGAAYLVAENIQIDVSFGASVKETPSILTGGVGLSWRFDANYEEVMLRLPGEEKADGKSKKDKKKEKDKKKRKDAIENNPVTP